MDKSKIKKGISVLSFLPILIHTTQHLLARSYFPFLFVIILTIVFSFLWLLKISKAQTIINAWCILLIGYGLIKIALVGLIFVAESGVPSDIYYQIDTWYFITTFVMLYTGIWLICISKKNSVDKKSITS